MDAAGRECTVQVLVHGANEMQQCPRCDEAVGTPESAGEVPDKNLSFKSTSCVMIDFAGDPPPPPLCPGMSVKPVKTGWLVLVIFARAGRNCTIRDMAGDRGESYNTVSTRAQHPSSSRGSVLCHVCTPVIYGRNPLTYDRTVYCVLRGLYGVGETQSAPPLTRRDPCLGRVMNPACFASRNSCKATS